MHRPFSVDDAACVGEMMFPMKCHVPGNVRCMSESCVECRDLSINYVRKEQDKQKKKDETSTGHTWLVIGDPLLSVLTCLLSRLQVKRMFFQVKRIPQMQACKSFKTAGVRQ